MRSLVVVGALSFLLVASLAVSAQTPGQNTNMVSGTQYPGGDPYLQRQNEPSVAISTRNPRHILAGANDYRTVDLPVADVLPGAEVTGDAWLGVFKSFDGGQTWTSTLLPGYPQDTSAQGMASPLKGFSTAADPTVRPGTNGTFYYSGIAFNRGTNQGVVFVARYIDLNNKENGSTVQGKDVLAYVGAATVDRGTAGQFLDKPTIAVDVPRGNATCTFQASQGGTNVSQTIPAGNVYLAYTVLVGNDINIRTKLYVARSTDCGMTWGQPSKLSEGLPVNQGSAIAIDPTTGYVYVAWRGFATNNTPNTINIARSTDGGATYTKAQTIKSLPSYSAANPAAATFFDQGTTATSFRSNAFPTMTVDASGRVYVAWSQRGIGPGGDARVVVTSSSDFVSWTAPAAADNAALADDNAGSFTRGHQFMPTLIFTDGRLMLLYYDERFDHTIGLFTPNDPFGPFADGRFYTEKRDPRGEVLNNPAAVYTPFVSDAGLTQMRHTIELRVAQAAPASAPAFNSVRLSQYKFGTRGDESGTVEKLQQLQINPPNLPLFQNGSAPFIGDYIDIAGLAMVNDGATWKFNTAFTKSPLHIATFTSNQDVRPPADGNWQHYTPAGQGGQSTYDPATNRPNCVPGQEGMRNQNIYSSVITQGLAVSAQQNSKPLSLSVPREFVITVQNATSTDKSFRLTILNQPASGVATFFPIPNPVPSPLPAAVVMLDVSVAAHSGIARGVYALSSSPTATIRVNVDEIDAPGGNINNGLSSFVSLNADQTVPSLSNPDGTSGVGISTAEIYNPNVSNPNVSNPNVSNPNVSNPNVSNPNVSNPNVSNPNVSNPNVSNPDLANPNVSNPNVSNPNVSNPNVSNPNVSNPNVSNAPLADATYSVENTGNTSSAYTVKLVGNAPGGTPLQLIVSKPYGNPLSENCTLFEQSNNVVLTNVNNPVVLSPGSFSDPQIGNPNISNATLPLGPGEKALVTIRGFNVTVEQMQQLITQITPVVVAQAANTNDPTNTPASSAPLFITTASLPVADLGIIYKSGTQAIGGVAPYTWTAASLPAGMTFSSAGDLGGTPTQVGTFNVAFTVADAASNTVTRTIPVRVINRQILINIPSAGVGGDLTDRGFYVTNYPGLDLQRATLYFSARTTGSYTFTLTARAGGYNGPVIGTNTQTITLTANASSVPTTFDFGSPVVTPGSTVAFTITETGPNTAFYEVSNCGLNDPNCTTADTRVTETEGSSGTLDTFRRVGVAVTIEGTPVPVVIGRLFSTTHMWPGN